ncbi:hypothetical protein B0H34DRAFT_785124 [Crassisporium funariophilum]|nr:hypothetical protein B0H34DRAFT_785124 [Crassisporium funariophilum]
MLYFIRPNSVDTYLLGICQQLKPFFPDVRKNHRARNVLTMRKQALTCDDLATYCACYPSNNHDNHLFLSMLFTGFFALLRLGKLAYPDNSSLQNPRKISRRLSVSVTSNNISYILPAHKADKYFKGNKVLLLFSDHAIDAYHQFLTYLHSQDRLFPYSGHSMRAGSATALAEDGASLDIIQAVGPFGYKIQLGCAPGFKSDLLPPFGIITLPFWG